MADDILTAKRFEKWIPVQESLSRVQAAIGEASATRAIFNRLRAGLLRAGAKMVLHQTSDGKFTRDYYRTISARAWGRLQNEDFWQTETAKFLLVFDDGVTDDIIALCSLVRFEPAGLDEMIPKPPRAAVGPREGGRPRSPYWDNMWIEIGRQLSHGELRPKRKVDIERAMFAWAARNGHVMGKTSARTRAKRLFAALQKQDKI